MGADQRALRGWRAGREGESQPPPPAGSSGASLSGGPGRQEGRGLGGSVGERKEAGREEGGNADKPPCSVQAVKRFLISQPPGEEGR